ncbi:MAG TPA: fatty acid desaturase, partial [Rhizomicrobium sp.]|nr:fatty acid desaturase [Rhizomicrobium sp.]
VVSAVSTVGLSLPSRLVERLVPKVEPMRTAAMRAFLNPDRQARIRADVVVTVLLIAAAVWCWGARWPIFAATIGARFFILSLLDNAPHYGTALDSGTYARNTRLPRWASWFVTGHNFHGVHHGATGLKWQELRAAFVNGGGAYEGSWAAMVMRQFRGPVVLDAQSPFARRG